MAERRPLNRYEEQARKLCALRKKDPDSMTLFGKKFPSPRGEMIQDTRAYWLNIAESLRDLEEKLDAIEDL